MKANQAVNFRAFYFNELLANIRRNAEQHLSADDREFLREFLAFFDGFESEQEGILKLAGYQSTSDLAIFFSDLLEQLESIPPDITLARVSDPASDFLDLFHVYLQQDGWGDLVRSELFESVAEVSEEESDALSYQEFYRMSLQEQISRRAEQLDEEQQAPFHQYLNMLTSDPALVDQILFAVPDERVNSFADIHRNIMAIQSGGENLDTFDSEASRWVDSFAELFTENFTDLQSVFEPSSDAEPAEALTGDEPFEALFDSLDADLEPAYELDEAESQAAIELDELVELAGQLEHRRPVDKPFTEEEKNRRKFLRDYVISEAKTHRADILDTMPMLENADRALEANESLRDSLKALLDLGQIHAYPGVETIAEGLLDLFENSDQTPLSSDQKASVEGLLAMVPSYIDAALEDNESEMMGLITSTLENLHKGEAVAEVIMPQAIDEDSDAVSLEDAPLKELVNQYVQQIKTLLQEGDGAASYSPLEPAFENLIYWTNLKNIAGAEDAVSCVRQLMEPAVLSELNTGERELISDIVGSWENAFENTDADTFSQYTLQLRTLLNRNDTVSIADSVPAFQEVTLRYLYDIVETLEEPDADLTTIIRSDLYGFIERLQGNSLLIQNDTLELFARMMRIKLEGFDPDTIENSDETRLELIAFLGQLHEQVSLLPEEVASEVLLSSYDTLMLRAIAVDPVEDDSIDELSVDDIPLPEAELINSSFADASGSDEASGVLGDTEIQEVFKLEALGYLNEIRDQVAALEKDLDNKALWKRLGVTTHTLKGSAQMVQRRDVTELATPLDGIVDLIEDERLLIASPLLKIIDDVSDVLRDRINGHKRDAADNLRELENYITTYLKQDMITQQPLEEEGVPIPEEKPAVEGFIHLKEQDPELLSIFSSEVTNNFDQIERNLTNLEKFTFDKEALREIASAVHEIRGASKMLGITEIANITDQLESVVEMLIEKKITEMDAAISVIRRAMVVIRELTEQHMVREEPYEEVLENIESLIEFGDHAVLRESSKFFDLSPDALSALQSEPEDITEPEPARIAAAPAALASPIPVARQVLELFIQEAHEQLDDINYLLLKLEKQPSTEDLQHHLMRCMHTLKGSAGMVYAQHIEAISHRCEDLVEYYIQEKAGMPNDLFDILFTVVDEIKVLLTSLERTSTEVPHNYASVIAALDAFEPDRAYTAVEVPVAAAPVEQVAVETPPGHVTVSTGEEEPGEEKKETFLRLNITKMNHLLNLAAELVISNNQFKNQLGNLKGLLPVMNSNLKVFRDTEDYITSIMREGKRIEENIEGFAQDSPGTHELMKNQNEQLQKVMRNMKGLQDEVASLTHLIKDNSKTYDDNLQKLNKLSNELLDEIMQARLVPINILFQRFHRPIRDLARNQEKQLNLAIKGEDTELDRTLIDDLYEPLLHLIRNAIDHGLESVEKRKAAGKNPEGKLEIKASRDRNQVIIEISDDGSGIDVDAVKAAAVRKGLISEAAAAKLSEQEAYGFLFYPGFSTARETTLVSGRGVGLDVVKSQIEKSKGDVRIYTEKGAGTTFSIRVPISLSVIQSMLVEVVGQTYSIPLSHVEETLHLSVQDLVTNDGRQYIKYRERQIQVVSMSRLLKLDDGSDEMHSSSGSYPVVLVQDEGQRIALLVDKIIRREEILIKSLGPGLRRLKFISGGSIMADGQVVLVLDILQILQDQKREPAIVDEQPAITDASANGAGKTIDKPRGERKKKQIEGRKPAALIVDDSLSIRKYLSSLLMQKGYVTDTARNGYEALELLNKQEFDIMVTDLEMPKLSGYELIETLRYDQRFTAFPIIVLTGRAGDNFRQLTTELGADAYIIKPFKDRELFDQIEKFIEYKV